MPAAAQPAVAIVRRLVEAGYQALLAGGCVRDLLLGLSPQDYDVATNAPPDAVTGLFRATRTVGAQFAVVLVRERRRWVEVATFRSDGPYLDGRHPVQVTFSDAQEDARRRDFTVNGLFLDPLTLTVVDYVGGLTDLEARVIRAIGEPAARFAEDYLRLLRAVRFAARLGFTIEPATSAAICAYAAHLPKVAAERVREELEKMFAAATRLRAWQLLGECRLRDCLWPGAHWTDQQAEAVARLLGRLPAEAPFELALAVLLLGRPPVEIERIGRALTLSNSQRETTSWLVQHAGDLDDPARPALADLKRLMASPAFPALRMLAEARYAELSDGAARLAALEQRLATIPAEAVQPPPLVTGADLLERRVPVGPAYKRILDALYTRQLEEELRTREQALAALEELLRSAAAEESA